MKFTTGKIGARAPRWTAAEDAALHADYQRRGAAALAAELGRTMAAVRFRASYIGATKRKSGMGSEECGIGLSSSPQPPAPSLPAQELGLWREYLAGGRRDTQLRNRLIGRHVEAVRRLAVHVAHQTGGAVAADDLTQVGWLGLVDAAQTFDPARGFAFPTLALRRARGAMLDELRRLDHVPRLDRQRSRAAEAVRVLLRQRLGREPSDDDLAAAGVPSAAIVSARLARRRVEALDEPKFASGHTLREELAVLLGTDARDVDDFFRAALRSQSLAQQTMIYLYFVPGCTMKEIGQVLRLSESRISQALAAAIEDLRRQFRREVA